MKSLVPKCFIVIIALAITCVYLREDRKNTETELGKQIETQNKQIKDLYNRIDTLEKDNFDQKTNVMRYEISLQFLNEVNPKAVKQFNYYLTHQTE